jgi:hypothetical protein
MYGDCKEIVWARVEENHFSREALKDLLGTDLRRLRGTPGANLEKYEG